MEEKIIFIYAKGMTTEDVEARLKELYVLDISDSTISCFADKMMSFVKIWQEPSIEGDICCCLQGCDPLPHS